MRLRYSVVLAVAASLALAGVAAAQNYVAVMTGLNETPVNTSTGTGNGTFTLTGNSLSYNITYGGLVADRTVNHIHGCAALGTNAGVIQGISCTGTRSGTCSGSITLNAAQIVCLNNGTLYANIHSTLYPGGEIRGQLLGAVVPTRPETWGRIKQIYR